MEFFKQLSEVGVNKLELQVVIKNETISVIITPELKNVKAIPLTVSGTAEELDEGFFDVITKPLQKAGGLASNVEEFEKSLENKPTEPAKAKGTTKPATAKEKPAKKTPPYKYQKYLDGILNIVNADGYELTADNKSELQEAVDKLLVMDAKNETALEWDKNIKDLTPKDDAPEEKPVEEKKESPKDDAPEEKPVEEKKESPKEDLPEPEKKAEKTTATKQKAEEQKVEEKTEKKVAPPPAPEETVSEDDEAPFFDDEDLDLDFEDFFAEQ